MPAATTKPAKIKSIRIDKIAHEDTPRGRAIVAALQGQTYMDLQVKFAPAGGSVDVWVETSRPKTTYEELRGMVYGLLISALTTAQLAAAKGAA